MKNDSSASVYIHIPFCRKKCTYCDFLSYENRETDFLTFSNVLCNDIEEFAKNFKNAMPESVPTIYFGGGTPTALPTNLLAKIFHVISKNFSVDENAVISIEANPETVDFEILKELREIGFNRISFGVQSFDDGKLQSIGRIHSAKRAVDAFNQAKQAGFEDINIDLMFGLPHQNLENFKDDLETAISLNPTHISCYSLTIEENTPIARNTSLLATLPNENRERAMYHTAKSVLSSAGYVHYEISNFAKPGYFCEHNRRYWLGGDYIGFGLGAASFINNARSSEIPCLDEYLERGSYDIQGQELSKNDRISEFMILGLRLIEGIKFDDFTGRFGVDITDIFSEQLSELSECGLLNVDYENKTAKLTDLGMDLSNQVFCEFLL
ncbi:MAG: radical SAM family heme chaperone HemW [Defluviitaleaceae bacterium]|nr:radical SAM family heme chaperone HemW [Defluviitaleaceae bacterium]